MKTARALTPLWVKLALATLAVGAPTWWLADRHDRLVNQGRLSEIASAIAGRPVHVHCPGPIGRLSKWDTVEGSVMFDADGNPADVAKLQPGPCAQLDALAEGRRTAELACVERSSTCGDDAQDVAQAVDVLSHESWHLHGIRSEAQTECRAIGTNAWTAQQLGATAEQGRALALLYRETGYELLPDLYRTLDCRP
jgi:hypothetical protein